MTPGIRTDYGTLYSDRRHRGPNCGVLHPTAVARTIVSLVQRLRVGGVAHIGAGNSQLLEVLREHQVKGIGFDYRPLIERGVQLMDLAAPGSWLRAESSIRHVFGNHGYLVLCDILEHLDRFDIKAALGSLHRLTDRFLLCSITRRPSIDSNLHHATVAPTSSWLKLFELFGFRTVSEPLLADASEVRDFPASPNFECIQEWLLLDPYREARKGEPNLILFEKVEPAEGLDTHLEAQRILRPRLPRIQIPRPLENAPWTFLVGHLQDFSLFQPLWDILRRENVNVIVRRGPERMIDEAHLSLIRSYLHWHGIPHSVVASIDDMHQQMPANRGIFVSASESTAAPSHILNSAFVIDAKARGHLTVLLQHGIWVEDFPEQVAFFSDLVLTWSREHEDCFKSPSPGVADGPIRARGIVQPSQFVITGCPKFDDYALEGAPDIELLLGEWARTYRKKFLLTTNLHWTRHVFGGQQFHRLVRRCAEEHAEWLFIVKLHPMEQPDAAAVRGAPANVVYLSESACWSASIRTSDLVRAVDGVVTTLSTVALEAALAGKPLLILDTGTPFRYRHLNLTSVDDLPKHLLRFGQMKEEVQNDRFASYYYDYSNRGAATANVLAAIARAFAFPPPPTAGDVNLVSAHALARHLTTYAGEVLKAQESCREKQEREKFTCQVYWCSHGSNYSEQESVRTTGQRDGAHLSLKLETPPLGHLIAALRIDIADCPGLISVEDFRVEAVISGRSWSLPISAEIFNSLGAVEMEALEDAQSNSRLLLLLKTSDPRLELPLPPDLLAELHNGARVHIALAWLTPEHAFLALQARGEMWKACSNEYCEAIKNLQSQNCERDELAAENDRLRSAASAWQATAALERTRASQRNEQLSAAREVARIRDLTPAQSLSSWRLRVLYLSDSLDAPYRYRCENAVFQLRAAGVIADLATTTHGEVPNLLADYSVVVLFRVAWTPVVDKLIQRVRSNGSTLVFDVDDLVFLHPRDAGLSFLSTADSLQQLRYQGFAARIRRVVDQSDYVLTSTPALASEAIEIGKPAFCHPNLLHPAMLRTSKTVSALSPLLRHRRIISYFSGSNTHDADLRSIAPALLAVLENDPRSLLLLGGFVGVPDVFKKRAGQIVRAPYVDWRVLPWLQGMSSCNLAPLAEVNRFTQCKSALKVIEAGAVGVPTVATPTEPIRAAVRHGETGFLAATEEAWVNGISSCLSQPARKRMGQSASRLVTSVFGIDAHRGQLAKLLLSMVPGNWRCPPKPHVARPLHDLVSDVPFKTLSEFHGDRLQRASTVLKLIRSANKPQNIDCGRDWVNEYETFVAFRQRSPKEPLPPGIRFQWGYTHQLRRGSDDDSDVWIATGVDPYMVSERCDVKCGQYLTLLVSMAVTSRDSAGVAQMYWSGTRSDTFSEEFSIRFPVVADGDVHMYTIWLDRMEDGTPTKWGRSDAAGRVRFDPFDEPATIRILDLALIETAHPD